VLADAVLAGPVLADPVLAGAVVPGDGSADDGMLGEGLGGGDVTELGRFTRQPGLAPFSGNDSASPSAM
jgi:hypothetical protein